MNEKNGKGFTFVEVEVSITLIFMAITGLGVLTVNGVKQLQALEKANPRVTMVSPDYSAAVTSIIYSPQNPRSDWYVVTLNSVSLYQSSVTAHTQMVPWRLHENE